MSQFGSTSDSDSAILLLDFIGTRIHYEAKFLDDSVLFLYSEGFHIPNCRGEGPRDPNEKCSASSLPCL